MSMSFRVIEDSFTPALRAMAENLPQMAADATEELLTDAEGFATSIVVVRTGYLRSTIGHRMLAPLEGELFAEADYAIFVEEGTRYMEARPFLRPAMENLMMDMPRRLLRCFYDAARI